MVLICLIEDQGSDQLERVKSEIGWSRCKINPKINYKGSEINGDSSQIIIIIVVVVVPESDY